MKARLFISFFLVSFFSFGQAAIGDIEDKKMLQKIEFIKAKTDSFLLTNFQKRVKSKFQFEFLNCGYFNGEMRFAYQFLNSDKSEVTDINNLTHNYSFLDKDLNLSTDIDIYFYEDESIGVRFQTTEDSLKYAA